LAAALALSATTAASAAALATTAATAAAATAAATTPKAVAAATAAAFAPAGGGERFRGAEQPNVRARVATSQRNP